MGVDSAWRAGRRPTELRTTLGLAGAKLTVLARKGGESYTFDMTTRERLHKLVDELPEDATAEAFALISDLAQPDDGRLSEDELQALDEADAAVAAGDVRPLSEARRDLGL